MLRVGMLTSGGDCQGLNAAMRGVAKTLFEQYDEVEVFGYLDGYKGLMLGDYRLMNSSDFSGILTLGGTILGTSRQSWRDLDEPLFPDSDETRIEAMIRNYNAHELDVLVVLGGNGTHKSALRLSQAGLNIITLPKTIDKDIFATEMTFGFSSAVDIATSVVDGIHTTATSHGRVFIIEVMGNKAGWLTLHSGIAGGADIILLPEIPYDLNSVHYALEKRNHEGKRFSIIAMAEGAKSTKDSELSGSDFEALLVEGGFPSPAYKLADELNKMMAQEVRVTVPGHYQRGGSPVPADRVFATLCGAHAAELIRDKKYGRSVVQIDNEVTSLPIEEVAHKSNFVPRDNNLIKAGRTMGISFGDELL